MKMREWFGSDCSLIGSDIAKGFISPSQYQAAAHAVNYHDKLVAMLEKILEVYEMDYDDTSEALTLLDEARGD
jgi:hypothetical protein